MLELVEYPWPEKALSWPQSRTLEDYLKLLLHPWSIETLADPSSHTDEIIALLAIAWQANIPLNLSAPDELINNRLQEGQRIVVDIGIGDGHALKEIKQQGNYFTVGFSIHEMNPVNKEYVDILCYSPVPHGQKARIVFEALRGKVALLLETFGASTYAENPIEALIFEGLLLAPEATAKIIVSSVLDEHIDQSPLGFALQRERLVNFFQDTLGLKLTITRTFIPSKVSVGTCSVDYHIEIHRPADTLVCDLPLETIYEMAQEMIGQCHRVPKSSDVGEFGHFGIRGRSYALANEPIQLAALDLTQEMISNKASFAEEKPVFTFDFTSNMAKNEFIRRFKEFYLSPLIDHYWQLSSLEDNSITIMYEGQQVTPGANRRKAIEDIQRICPSYQDMMTSFKFFSSEMFTRPLTSAASSSLSLPC